MRYVVELMRISDVLKTLSTAVLSVCVGISDLAAQSARPVPPDGHPRLLLQRADIPRVKARFASGLMAAVKDLVMEQAAATSNGVVFGGEPSDTKRRAFEARALLFLVEDDTTAGLEAVRMVLDYFRTLNPTNSSVDLETGRETNRSIVGAAMVYDWCYDLFTPEERRELFAEIKRAAGNTEYRWPPTTARFVSGHYGEDKHPSMLAAGIAVYDEDPSIYDLMAQHLYEGFVPARNFFYPGGKHHQGSSYGINRFGNEVFGAFVVWAMGKPSPYVPDQRKVPYFNMYNRTPDGFLMPEGDDNSRRGGERHWYAGGGHVFQSPRQLYMIATMFQDPYVLDEALRYGSVAGEDLRDAAMLMLLWDETLEPGPVSELPLTRYFGSPFGQMIARTDWDVQAGKDADAVVARMNIGEYYFANHDHLDAGHFSLYYKGLLALDAGIYQGKHGGYGSPHFNNYLQRTVSHNSLLILDPDEPLPRTGSKEILAQDGGQFWPHIGEAEFRSVDEVIAHGRHATILAHEFGPDSHVPDYSFLKGDMARAYQAHCLIPGTPLCYPPKVSEVKRSFVFLNLKNAAHPAALVVFDRVVSRKPEFTKKWLLHSTNEPSLQDAVVDIRRTEDGYNGRLVNHTLLPRSDDLAFEKIGGEGYEFWSDGANWTAESHTNAFDEPGAWRVEISPMRPDTVNHFLNVMQVMDAVGGPEPLQPVYLETEQLAGVGISDRVVFFSKDGRRQDDEVRLAGPNHDETMKYLVTDLAAGSWSVTGPVSMDVEATEEGGAVYFEGPSGSYVLQRSSPSTGIVDAPEKPVRLALEQNYPNPFNPETRIRFVLPAGAEVRLEVFDVLGRRIDVMVDGYRGAGTHEVVWNPDRADAGAAAGGVYFYRLQADDETAVRRMTLLN